MENNSRENEEKIVTSSEPSSIFDLVSTNAEKVEPINIEKVAPVKLPPIEDEDYPPSGSSDDVHEPSSSSGDIPKMSQSVAKREAEGITTFINFTVSRMCSAYSGEDPSRYKMTGDEKADFEKVTALAIQDVGGLIPPIWQFVGALLALLTGMGFLAHEDAQARDRKERALAKVRSRKADIESDLNVLDEMGVRPHNKSGLGRQQFQIDKDGYYHRNEAGTYIKGSQPEKQELKAPKMIVDIIKELEGQNKTTGEINKYIIENVSFEDRNRYE